MTQSSLVRTGASDAAVLDFPDHGFDVVTGAFGYSGSAIARELGQLGRRVRTLTGHPGRGEGATVDIRPLDFDDVIGLTSSLQGATTLYNTYWVRFPRGGNDFDRAVANSRTLFHAARQAGVERIVHVSITNPSISSPYGYFRGKAEVERALAEVGVPYAVLRPAILFGGDGVLVNNIAWLLRRLPLFAVGGRGDYRIRGVHVDDLAALAVAAGAERTNTVIDAVGPERPTFMELVELIRDAVDSRCGSYGSRARWCRRWLRSSVSSSTTSCSPATSPGPWRTGWPTPMGRRRGHRRQRVDPGQRRHVGADLRQRDRPALPAPAG